MSTIITMPQKGLTEDSAVLAKWYVKQGDHVKAGDCLFAIEIGKAAFDVESESDGMVLALWAQEGDNVPVKAPVCAVGQEGEKVQKPEFPSLSGVTDPPAQSDTESEPAPPSDPDIGRCRSQTSRGCLISPRAKLTAQHRGIDYRFAAATGPGGRIIERDIDAMTDTGPFITDAARSMVGMKKEGTGLGGAVTSSDLIKPAPYTAELAGSEGYTVRPNSHMRRLIAQNMHDSLTRLAQFTLSTHFDATGLLAYCNLVKAEGAASGLSGISLNDIIVYTAARVIKEHPELNAAYSDSETRLFAHVNAGIAVDTPRGLMVPTVFHADEKSLDQISREIKQLAQACRQGRIDPELLTGGTVTVSNLGSMGISSFTPVINPPQVCLLGVCALEWKVRMDETGTPHYYQAMGLSLTIDHRAVDGAPAARFLQALCRRLEVFTLELAR